MSYEEAHTGEKSCPQPAENDGATRTTNKIMKTKSNNPKGKSVEMQPRGLVGGEELLADLFPNTASRPSLRWLRRQQEKRTLPFIKIGKLVVWDIQEVRRAIDEKMTVRATDR